MGLSLLPSVLVPDQVLNHVQDPLQFSVLVKSMDRHREPLPVEKAMVTGLVMESLKDVRKALVLASPLA